MTKLKLDNSTLPLVCLSCTDKHCNTETCMKPIEEFVKNENITNILNTPEARVILEDLACCSKIDFRKEYPLLRESLVKMVAERLYLTEKYVEDTIQNEAMEILMEDQEKNPY